MVLIAADDSLKDAEFCDKCGTESRRCEQSLKSKQQTFILCFCNSLVRKRRQSKRRNTTEVNKSQYLQNQQGNISARRTSLPARITIMGAVESKTVEGSQTPIPHRRLLGDPRSPTTGIERTPIAIEKATGESPVNCHQTELCATPVKGHFMEDPRSPNCPRTPIPLSDPRSPCDTASRTPIFVKPLSGHESDKTDTDKFVFGEKQTPSPPKIETTEGTPETLQSSAVNTSNKETIDATIDEVTECLKQITTPEYDEALTNLVRTNEKNDVIYRDEPTDTKELPKTAKSNRPNLKKIHKKKIQELTQGQQRSPLATRNQHSDSPIVTTNKTRTYVRFDRNAGDFRKRQNSLGSTGTRLSTKFEIFTEKENV